MNNKKTETLNYFVNIVWSIQVLEELEEKDKNQKEAIRTVRKIFEKLAIEYLRKKEEEEDNISK